MKYSNTGGHVMMFFGVLSMLAALVIGLEAGGSGFRPPEIRLMLFGGLALTLAGAFARVTGMILVFAALGWFGLCILAALGAWMGRPFLGSPLYLIWPGARGLQPVLALVVGVFPAIIAIAIGGSLGRTQSQWSADDQAESDDRLIECRRCGWQGNRGTWRRGNGCPHCSNQTYNFRTR
jgi:hypothetical protein